MNPVPAFPSVADAMAAVQAGLRFVAAADATRMSAQAQAEALQMMERANAIVTAARASVLSAFTSDQGYSADADYSPRAWLIHKTRVTKVVAVAHTAWAKRMVTHPRWWRHCPRTCRSPTAADLPVDRQAARGLPSGRRRDLAVRR